MKKTTYDLICEELEKARSKFPASEKLLHAFAEESGEVTKAFLDMHHLKGNAFDIRKELIQAATVAIRLLEEGDPEFPGFRFCPFKGCEQPMVGGPCALCYE